ncbi:MAG: RNA 2'-phosphotransferase [Rubripirellula sp.]
MNKRLTKISKYLTFILRHEPQAIGLKLDPERWLNIDELIKNANAAGKSVTLEQLHEVVASSEDKLFEVSDDNLRIRVSDIMPTKPKIKKKSPW